MNVEINIWAVLLAFVASMVVGSIWYAKPVFGEKWLKLNKMSEKKAEEGASRAMVRTLPIAFVQAYTLAFITYIAAYFYADKSWLNVAILTGIAVWVFQVVAVAFNDTFEQRPTKLTLINTGNQLVTLLVMALVIGMLQP